MKRMEKEAMVRPTSEAKGYLDHLKKLSVFRRAVDAYAFAAAFAMNQGMDISAVALKGRYDLTDVGTLDEEVRLALEAGAAQMGQLCDLLVKAGWQQDPSTPRVYCDLLGHDRVVVVRKQR